jgi:ubiquitin-like-specific protease 1C/D
MCQRINVFGWDFGWDFAPQVPLQDNEWDCGLFMLYYIERFVQEAPPRWDSSCLSKMVNASKKQFFLAIHEMFITRIFLSLVAFQFGRSWFQPTEASQLRDTILTLLESIFDQVSR